MLNGAGAANSRGTVRRLRSSRSPTQDHRRIEIDPTNSSRIWWTGNTSGRIGYVELLK
jgi:hypothetical protein